jgi:hypothetical protein
MARLLIAPSWASPKVARSDQTANFKAMVPLFRALRPCQLRGNPLVAEGGAGLKSRAPDFPEEPIDDDPGLPGGATGGRLHDDNHPR